jgi:O-antigen/teichoic acid export membrane protein
MTPDSSAKFGSLKQRVLRAVGWSFSGYGASMVIRLASTLIMTRLLEPEMFGVMAIAGMVLMVLALLSDIGLRQHIVQSARGDDPAFLDTAWTVQIVRGVGLWLAASLLSVALYWANAGGMVPQNSVYASPILPLVIAIVSFAAAIGGFQSTRIIAANRRFDQKRLAQSELIAQIAGLIVMVSIGMATRSIWALVAGGLVSAVTTTVLSFALFSGHSNKIRLERTALRELVSFGKWVFISSAVGVFAANGDRLLLGGLVDAKVLGLYSIAVLIVGTVQGAFVRFASAVALPALSEIARTEPQRLREVYYKLRAPVDAVLLFLSGLLFASSQLLIDVLYDPRYAQAGGMLQILALSLIVMRYESAQQVYLAIGRPRYLAIINIVRCASLYAVVPLLFYLGGTHAAIWGIALHALATLPFVFIFNRRLGLNDLRRELLAFLILPVGYLFGILLNLGRSLLPT